MSLTIPMAPYRSWCPGSDPKPTCEHRTGLILERGRHVGPSGLERGWEAEDQAGEARNAGREEQDAEIGAVERFSNAESDGRESEDSAVVQAAKTSSKSHPRRRAAGSTRSWKTGDLRSIRSA